jgi:glycosyltransferase involved in cell wall biosynthesis
VGSTTGSASVAGGGRGARRSATAHHSTEPGSRTAGQGGALPGEPRGGTVSLAPMGAAPFAKLSVFYPMWNEEDYIERALEFGGRACRDLVERGDIGDYELIIVNDASTDRTPEIADKLAAHDPHVRVIHHPRNRKLGGAMKTGFAAATGDLILYTDADLPFDMAELPRAVRLLREYEADIVSAYRLDRTGEGSLRSLYTWVYNALIKSLFGVKVRDINFAFKLCRAKIFDDIELKSEGSFIDAELVIRATRMGYSIMQMGVDYFPRTRGTSTLSSPGVILTILREMWSLRGDLEQIERVH